MTPDRRKVGGKTQPLRLLAIGHEASRSGAVIIHLGWLNWAAARPERFQVSSLLVRPGPLLAEWPRAFRVATLSHLDQARSRMERWVSTRLVDRPRFVARRFRRYLAQLDLRDIDVVLANTLTLGWLLAELPPGGCPVVVHAHELAGATGRFAAPRDLAVLRQMTSRWIAVSEAVRCHLVENLAVAPERVAVVRNFLPPRAPLHLTRAQARAQLAALHRLSADVPWIVTLGNLAPVKAPAMFLAAAGRIREVSGRACQFIWVGDGARTAFGRAVLRSPAARPVFFAGPVADPRIWLTAADFALVTSVEESSSLVALEAAEAGTPVIAFLGTGGSDEFLGEGAGLLVAERSVEALTAAAARWLDRPDEAARCAAVAAERARREGNYENQCEALAAVLESVREQQVQ